MPTWLVYVFKVLITVSTVVVLIQLGIIVKRHRKNLKTLSMIVLYILITLVLVTNVFNVWVDLTIIHDQVAK